MKKSSSSIQLSQDKAKLICQICKHKFTIHSDVEYSDGYYLECQEYNCNCMDGKFKGINC